MKIKVTAKHIRCGKKGDGRSCAIALALKEVYKTNNVHVFNTWTIVNKDYMFNFSRNVIKFIKDFDKKKSSVKPFEFSL